MIKPTVGRVVWYYEDVPGNAQPMAAVVCYVHSDRMVNLTTFGPNGDPIPKTSVRLVQDGDPAYVQGSGSYCTWMPYQMGQAKKTEQAEAVAEAVRKGYRS